MRTVKIVADSSANIISLDGVSFASSPLKVITDCRKFVDDANSNAEEMIQYFETYKGRSKTSCPNTVVWLDAFGEADDIFCVTITSGIALEKHKGQMPAEERQARRQALGIPEDHTVLLNLGRLGIEKNLTELLQLLSMELTHNKKVTLLIVGDGPARQELEEMADHLGIRDHVVFTGMVPPDEVHIYYQLGDIFVSASTSETQGLTYVEAAANGLPLLCRRDPCLDEVLIEGSNGYEYEAESEFCSLLDTILQNPEWCKAAGAHSKEIAATFDKGHFADKIEDVYEKVISE